MVQEEITLEGHIIDSLVLTRVLDEVVAFGGDFRIVEMHVGVGRHDRSHARLEVAAETPELLQQLLQQLTQAGAIVHQHAEAALQPADLDGAFPDGFYATTNLATLVRHEERWWEVELPEMDCGIRFDPDVPRFVCVPMIDVKQGDLIVCGHRGVKVVPYQRGRERGVFDFMTSAVSTEKPKTALIRNCARRMLKCKQEGRNILLVGGPAIIHTGSADRVVHLIERGYINLLFAGNALAAHDIEHALYGTSLGVFLEKATLAETGHEHHLRAINTIRRLGGIRPAVEQGVLNAGVMHACVRHNVPYVLAGSIRDDGPLPDVMSDAIDAQRRMRASIQEHNIGFALMIATGLHSIATGNLIPAETPAVCVDMEPTILTKLADRGSYQTLGLVTDAAPFLRLLVQELDALEAAPERNRDESRGA